MESVLYSIWQVDVRNLVINKLYICKEYHIQPSEIDRMVYFEYEYMEEEIKKEIARCQNMLSNPNFVNKAPEAKVNLEREKLAKHEENLSSLLKKKEQVKKYSNTQKVTN